jgi:hypothetical protein
MSQGRRGPTSTSTEQQTQESKNRHPVEYTSGGAHIKPATADSSS